MKMLVSLVLVGCCVAPAALAAQELRPDLFRWISGERMGWILMLVGTSAVAYGLRIRSLAPARVLRVIPGWNRFAVIRGGRRSVS